MVKHTSVILGDVAWKGLKGKVKSTESLGLRMSVDGFNSTMGNGDICHMVGVERKLKGKGAEWSAGCMLQE